MPPCFWSIAARWSAQAWTPSRVGVVPERGRGRAVRGLEGAAAQFAALGELDRHLQPQHPQVPLGAGADVADRDLHMVDRAEVGMTDRSTTEEATVRPATHEVRVCSAVRQVVGTAGVQPADGPLLRRVGRCDG